MKLPRILLLLALAAPALAWGQDLDRPERIARLSYVEGEVTFQAARERPTSTLPNRPLAAGDSLATDPRARAELALGNATVRLDERSELAITDLEEDYVRLELSGGSASVFLDELLEDEAFEILTPNATITLDEPGQYRVDVYDDDDAALSVHGGAATVETAAGPVRITAGQRVQLDGRNALARLEAMPPEDAFDDWVLARELRLAEAEPARYTPYEGDDYRELDRYGDWYDDPYYGRVWMPGYGYSGWSPYRSGYWQRAGFGWSWIDPAPWGFFSYYGGRWTYLQSRNRWCWVPTRQRPHRYAHDYTRPYGHPRGYPRNGGTPESAPRTADRRAHRDDDRPRVATPTLAPRGIDRDRRPTRARDYSAGETPRGGTYARGGNRQPTRSQPAAPPSDRGANARPSRPAAAPPGNGGGATVRPSRPEPARSAEAPDRGQGRREFGARREP